MVLTGAGLGGPRRCFSQFGSLLPNCRIKGLPFAMTFSQNAKVPITKEVNRSTHPPRISSMI